MVTSSLALIGAGVRGTAALGRIAARLRHRAEPLDIHVVDPYPVGSGSIWRTEQSQFLVMNTVAAQSTVFDDASTAFEATLPGPNFAEWCEGVAAGAYEDPLPWVGSLARGTRPWSSPSRALYGRYLQWAFRRFSAALPASVRLQIHRDRATTLARAGNGYEIELASGATVRADSVLLALGWLPRDTEDGTDIRGGSPIDQGLDTIAAGERIAVRGIGMGFIDLLSIVTEERGGAFSPFLEAPRSGALHYTPSGREPRVYAGSRSGLPFLAKPDFGTVPPAANFDALSAALPSLLARRPLDFDREVLPYIEHAAAWEHYRALAEHHPVAFAEDPERLLRLFEQSADPDGPRIDAWRPFAERAVPDAALRFDPERVTAPVHGATAAELDGAVIERIERDAAEAALGHASAIKRGLHVYQAARAAIVPLTDFGGITPETRPQLGRFLTRANLAGSGPPLYRVEQLIALHRAGIVTFLGPQLEVRAEGSYRLAGSMLASTEAVPIDRVVDARLDLPDVARLADPLLDSLLDAGLARVSTAPHSQPTIEIGSSDSALIGIDGRRTPGLHSVGPLHEELRRFTIIAPIPGANSTVLREIDAAVAAMLEQVSSTPAPLPRRG